MFSDVTTTKQQYQPEIDDASPTDFSRSIARFSAEIAASDTRMSSLNQISQFGWHLENI